MKRDHGKLQIGEKGKSDMKPNLNTILMALMLAVMGWMLHTTFANSELLTRLAALQEERFLGQNRMEARIENMQLQLHSMELEIAKMKPNGVKSVL
ncbi:MAG TPA: hypothetical protein VF077_12930 [Nitrospiraceae bacterium]